MSITTSAAILLGCYLLGSVPFGLVLVRIVTGRDIRSVQSGRTGGTNAMRAAGFWVGLSTALLDFFKAAVTVWIVRALGGSLLLEALAPLAAILGHNASVFLIKRDEQGRLRLSGGAGGAAALGGAMGLWPGSILIILPIAIILYYFVGYASLATLSVSALAIVIFAVRAIIGTGPWEYVAYGIGTLALLGWALRPNIKRLLEGTERIHGFRARKNKAAEAESS
ncbi:MAG: glycerol-3-phosphate acyltransferase [Chloroflexi bacterium]|nr:MAG: glycerol-3-phosphate acyltransferase [Chloroflexota bacterium]MBL1195875.1 glycerol-3-phosphate acyltransferase [Chloroflexota bacterium]NOH13167.1 glycerol-3-phosphate acyltransferase [Chloroflexota bacterium]